MKGFIALLALLVIFGGLQVQAQNTQILRVQVNHEKRFAKGKLAVRFTELVEDSRCPADTTCIWAGNAQIKIRVRGNGRTHDLVLDTNGPNHTATAEGYSIKLIRLTPEPRSNIRINRNGYVATLQIVKLKR